MGNAGTSKIIRLVKRGDPEVSFEIWINRPGAAGSTADGDMWIDKANRCHYTTPCIPVVGTITILFQKGAWEVLSDDRSWGPACQAFKVEGVPPNYRREYRIGLVRRR